MYLTVVKQLVGFWNCARLFFCSKKRYLNRAAFFPLPSAFGVRGYERDTYISMYLYMCVCVYISRMIFEGTGAGQRQKKPHNISRKGTAASTAGNNEVP